MLPQMFADAELMKIVADDMDRAYTFDMFGEPVARLVKKEIPWWRKGLEVVGFTFIIYNMLKKVNKY